VIGSSIRAGGAISKVMASADEAGMLTASAREVNQAANLARTSQVLNGASTVTDGAALADSTYGLAKGWDKLSPEQRLMAIGQIGFWGGMMAHSSHEAMGNNFYASKDVDAFMHGVASRPKESLTNPAIPESRPVVERVQGAVREGFALSEADARVLGAMNGEGSHPIELSPQLKQQLGIYGKKVTTEDVLRRLGSIEKKKQQLVNSMRAEEPKAETVVPGQTREEKSNGQSLQARYQELKRQQQEGGTSAKPETAQPTSKTTNQEPQVKSPELIQREQELSQALPKRQQVPVEIDPNLQGNAVRVHYAVDKKGQITDIQIKAGAQATPKDIQLHASTVKRMQQYSGLSRHVQVMKDRIKGWVNKNGVPPVGTKAWEAQLEIEKLPHIIAERAERLANGGLDEKSQLRLEAELADLKLQMVEHEKTLKMMDKDPGKGFVAAESPGSKKAEELGRPEAEDGYRWVLEDGKLRYDRDEKMLPDGNIRPQKAYDPSSGKFVDVNADIKQPKIKSDKSETHAIPASEQTGYGNNLKDRDLARNRRDKLKALKEKDPNNFTEAQERELSRAIYEVNEHSRQIGDKGAVSYMQQKYPDAVLEYGGPGTSSRPSDFDQVWRVPGKGADGGDLYIVVEAKGGSGPLGTRKVKNGTEVASQGSKEYFDDITQAMSENRKSSEAQRVGDSLSRARKRDDIQYLEVRTPIGKDTNGDGTITDIKVREFDISDTE
jgi:hypothetical protein